MTLYSTEHCPMCKMLKAKLDAANIDYEVCMDLDKMEQLGIKNVPVLENNNELMNLGAAIQLINEIERQRGVSNGYSK